VLGPLPFEAVGQEHDQAARTQPLRLAGGDELVDDRLRAIGEVPELRFPQHQRLRIRQRVAVFESEHAEFGERWIPHLEAAAVDLAPRNMLPACPLAAPY